ncbi:MAG: hypothetical protein MUO26_02550 [Methanotrichaceae archaeon]|nr:hypothetical protein [Methanotrichaceae archaeon]
MIPCSMEDAEELTEYISKALKQASHEATMLPYSPDIDPFREDLNGSSRMLFKVRMMPFGLEGERLSKIRSVAHQRL